MIKFENLKQAVITAKKEEFEFGGGLMLKKAFSRCKRLFYPGFFGRI